MVTYEEQILSEDLPGSIVIAGAGAIGVEFAYVLHNYGVKVTIVEFLDRIVPLEDEEVSDELAKRYKRLGIDVLTSTRVSEIEESDPGVRVTVTRDGEDQVLEADKVLQAIGFQPKRRGLRPGEDRLCGLDRPPCAARSTSTADCRTSVPHIFAIGDVTAKLMLAHAAEAMGIVAAETIAGAETMELDYVMIPRATYCQPQIACSAGPRRRPASAVST